MNVESVWLQRYGKRYGKRDRMNTGHDPTETAKGTAKAKTVFLIEKTAPRYARNKSAPRPNVATTHENKVRMNIHTYTHKNNIRTKIYYIHTDNNVRMTIYLHIDVNIPTYIV